MTKRYVLILLTVVGVLNAQIAILPPIEPESYIIRDDVHGIVLDTRTKLEWQDDAIGTTINWQGAIDRCESLTLGGHDDWRLPNINELKSIVDRSKSNPAIVNGFDNTSSNYYWSSTSIKGNEHNAWIVSFGNGFVYYNNKDGTYYVRCVRGGQ